MLRVGLTGGIASGKSAIGSVFVSLGAQLIKADDIAHQLMSPGLPVYDEVVRSFGPEILNPDKTISRKKLADVVFGNSGPEGLPRIQQLNKIVHPAVLQAQEAWMENVGRNDPASIAIVEAALILEAGARSQFDCLIVVTCQPEQRVQRMAERLTISLESARQEVERRMAAQIPDEEKIKAADYVIDNSGTLETSQKRAAEIFADLQLRRLHLANEGTAVHTKRKT
jgi:dephospho-CoA kinase